MPRPPPVTRARLAPSLKRSSVPSPAPYRLVRHRKRLAIYKPVCKHALLVVYRPYGRAIRDGERGGRGTWDPLNSSIRTSLALRA